MLNVPVLSKCRSRWRVPPYQETLLQPLTASKTRRSLPAFCPQQLGLPGSGHTGSQNLCGAESYQASCGRVGTRYPTGRYRISGYSKVLLSIIVAKCQNSWFQLATSAYTICQRPQQPQAAVTRRTKLRLHVSPFITRCRLTLSSIAYQ